MGFLLDEKAEDAQAIEAYLLKDYEITETQEAEALNGDFESIKLIIKLYTQHSNKHVRAVCFPQSVVKTVCLFDSRFMDWKKLLPGTPESVAKTMGQEMFDKVKAQAAALKATRTPQK